jgi:hypothetical protein
MELYQLYNVAAANHIPVFRRPMPHCRSASVQLGGSCAIALDQSVQDCLAVETTHLGHELGHCMTGSFYNAYSGHDVRQKHEIRADKWAIELLVPAAELDDAIAMGRTELWELAEYFHVTEAFMRKAVCYHTHGNLATELYF